MTETLDQKLENDFKCKLEFFEGPLDLLLYLIKKNEIDINNIHLEPIINQYMDYINLMQQMDVDIASEFIVTAATLLHIKTKWLLPASMDEEAEDEETDPRLDLLHKLLEYKKFKEASSYFENLHSTENAKYKREFKEEADIKSNAKISNISIYDLQKAFAAVLKRFESTSTKNLHGEHFTVQDKMIEIRNRILNENEISFNNIFDNCFSKEEVICNFLAVLELIRLDEIIVSQKGNPFSEIKIYRKDESDNLRENKYIIAEQN